MRSRLRFRRPVRLDFLSSCHDSVHDVMSKRPLSPAPLPPPKRLHDLSTSQHSPDDLQPRLPFDVLLFDEIILVILSYLSWTDLCAVQRTNKNLARLSLDNQVHI